MPARPAVDPAEFARLAQEGATNAALAERFRCDLGTVSRWRRRLGVPSPRTVRLEGERRAQVERALEDGWSVKEIERTYGVEHRTIERHFPGRQWSLAKGLDRQRAERHFTENVKKVAYATTIV